MSGANDMSSTLGEVFGTTKVASATSEDMEKAAQVEFFNGLCKEQGINIEELTDPQIDQLWKTAMEIKAAEFPPNFAKKDDGKKDDKGEKKDGDKKDDKEKEADAKLAAAEAEFLQKRAAYEKVAEADAMGRIIAHSFVAELNKIAEKEGGFPFPPKKDGDDKGDGKKDDKKDDSKKEASAAEKVEALTNAFQAAKTASAPAAASDASMPNFDEQAAYTAIELLKTAGVDEQLAFNKVNAAYVLGLGESVKLASAPDLKTGLHVRALEICEAAGFQVDWPSA
jgi:hypothetical protein